MAICNNGIAVTVTVIVTNDNVILYKTSFPSRIYLIGKDIKMTIDTYFSRYLDHSEITLVGPMHPSNTCFDDPVIFVDGGSKYRKNMEGYLIGDGDSYIGGKLDQLLNPDKDFSDLAYVLHRLTNNFSYVKLQGFLGGRRDHELFNFGETHNLLKCRDSSTMLKFDDSVVAVSEGHWQFEITELFSIAVIQSTAIKLTGKCQYQCLQEKLFHPLSSHGLSNRGFGTIYLNCQGPVFVLFDKD